MAAISEEAYLTVAEAAAFLRVSEATVRRWIRQGPLPAYRVGRQRLRIQQSDLTRVLMTTPTRQGLGGAPTMSELIEQARRPLTKEEKRRGLAAIERAERHSSVMLAERGGRLFPSSWELIDEERDERTRELEQAMGWCSSAEAP